MLNEIGQSRNLPSVVRIKTGPAHQYRSDVSGVTQYLAGLKDDIAIMKANAEVRWIAVLRFAIFHHTYMVFDLGTLIG